jgi:hypothetical protein
MAQRLLTLNLRVKTKVTQLKKLCNLKKNMDTKEIVGFVVTGIGVAFGFGRQAAMIATARRDIDSIANLHRLTLEELHDIAIAIAKIEQRLGYLEKS